MGARYYRISLRAVNKYYKLSQTQRMARLCVIWKNAIRVSCFFGGPEYIIAENADQTPLHGCESGAEKNQKTWEATGSDYAAIVQNFAKTHERFTLMGSCSSRPLVAQPATPEIVFRGVGTKVKLRKPLGITVQWAEKGSYKEEHICIWIQNNLRPGEVITAETPWRILFLDKYSGHLGKKVHEAAHAKRYILLIIPGGLTPDVQVCDTDMNRPFKKFYRDIEDQWTLMQRSNGVALPTPTRELMLQWAVRSFEQLDFQNIANGFKRNGLMLALDGTEDVAWLRDDLLEIWEQMGIPAFRKELQDMYAAGKGPKTIDELENTLTDPRGVPEEDDEWDVEYVAYETPAETMASAAEVDASLAASSGSSSKPKKRSCGCSRQRLWKECCSESCAC